MNTHEVMARGDSPLQAQTWGCMKQQIYSWQSPFGAIHRSQSAPHMHVLVCIRSDVRQFHQQWLEPHNCYDTQLSNYVYTLSAWTVFCQPRWICIAQYRLGATLPQ